MKRLKFLPKHIPLILSGEKTATWRMKDEKNLTTGDEVELVDRESNQPFAKAVLTSVKATNITDFGNEDKAGNLEFQSKEAMLEWFRHTYGEDVTMGTPLKIVRFEV